MESNRDALILVHGTGATAPTSSGNRWWQDEGPLWSLASLPEAQGLAVEAFIWSGANDESERRKAGAALAARLIQLEREGRKAHLICHSHGGSVAWHALELLRTRHKGDDSVIASMATVGTPFLHYGARRARLTIALFSFVASAGALAAAAFSIWQTNWGYAWRDNPEIVAAWTALALLPLGILLWSTFALADSLRHRRGMNLQARARNNVETFRNRYLCLYSRFDEPIIGLGASNSISMELGSRWNPVPRAAGQLASNVLSRLVQGSTIVGLELRKATHWPAPELAHHPLPEATDAELARQADDHAASLGRRVRGILASGSDPVSGFVDLQRSAAEALTFRELIHTTYFENPGCIDLLATHLGRHGALPGRDKGGYDDWYDSRYATPAQEAQAAKAPRNAMGAVIGLAVAGAILSVSLTLAIQLLLAQRSFGATRAEYWLTTLVNERRLAEALTRFHGSSIVTASDVDTFQALTDPGEVLVDNGPNIQPLRLYLSAFTNARAIDKLEVIVGRLPSKELRDYFYRSGFPLVLNLMHEGDVDNLIDRSTLYPGPKAEARGGIYASRLAGPALTTTVVVLTQRKLLNQDRLARLAKHCGADEICQRWLRVQYAIALVMEDEAAAAKALLPLPSYDDTAMAAHARDMMNMPRPAGMPPPATTNLLKPTHRAGSTYITLIPRSSKGSAAEDRTRLVEWLVENGEWDYALAFMEASRPVISWDKVGPSIEKAAKSISGPRDASRLLAFIQKSRFDPVLPIEKAEMVVDLQMRQTQDLYYGFLTPKGTSDLVARLIREYKCSLLTNPEEATGDLWCPTKPSTRQERLASWRSDALAANGGLDDDESMLRVLVRKPNFRAQQIPEPALARKLLQMLIKHSCDGGSLPEPGEKHNFVEALKALGPAQEVPAEIPAMIEALKGGKSPCPLNPDDNSQPWIRNFVLTAVPLAMWLESHHSQAADDLVLAAVNVYVGSFGVSTSEALPLLEYFANRWLPYPVLIAAQRDLDASALLRRDALLQTAICRHAAGKPDAPAVAQLAFETAATSRSLARASEVRRSAVLEALWHARRGDWRRAATTCETCDIEAYSAVVWNLLPHVIAGVPPTTDPPGADCVSGMAVDVAPLLVPPAAPAPAPK